MKRWDYRCVLVRWDGLYKEAGVDGEYKHHITELGAEGWELAKAVPHGAQNSTAFMVFRRPWEEPRDMSDVKQLTDAELQAAMQEQAEAGEISEEAMEIMENWSEGR